MDRYSMFQDGAWGEDEDWRETLVRLITSSLVAAVWDSTAGDFRLFALPEEGASEDEYRECADSLEKAVALDLYRTATGDELNDFEQLMGCMKSHSERLGWLRVMCLVALLPPHKQEEIAAHLQAFVNKRAS